MTEQTLTLITHNPSFSLHNKPNSRSQDAIISKVSIIVTFSDIKAEVTKFDLALQYVKINIGLSFERNVMCISDASYGPTGSWKQFFLSIYTIYGHGHDGSNLGHVTSLIC